LGTLLFICGAGGGFLSETGENMGREMVVTDSRIEVAAGRVLNITLTADGVVVVQNEWDGGLRTWMVPSVAALRWLIYEATAGENTAENLPPLNSIVLEREQVERFQLVARPHEVKTQDKEV
jgi:hypothetical protein